MPKSPASQVPSPRQLLRLIDIDELIRSEKRQTIATLAAATERSERTIRYDLDMLRDSFEAPLTFTRPQGSGRVVCADVGGKDAGDLCWLCLFRAATFGD
jgi:predicted DNA-binding transcriptional regulator YafY